MKLLKQMICQRAFCIEGLIQIEWSLSIKQNNGRAYEIKNENQEYHFDYYFEFDTNTATRLVSKYFNRLSILKRLSVAHTTIYKKKAKKLVFFSNVFFHWIEIE